MLYASLPLRISSTVRARRRSSDASSKSESASIVWTTLSSLSLRPHGELARTWMYIGLGAPWRRSPRPSPLLPTAPPAPLTPGVVWAAAETLTPSARFSRYIYVSTRDTGVQTPAGDSIAIFEDVGQGTLGEKLQLMTQEFTGLGQLKGMQFGEWLNAG
ncbi:hypothetical protein B0H14DRAFT_3858701 [Mycena olivaceomarginata]|nr:hypothetical protein B0H14DRAFT_3858701 [Mycena olivaceomarginata]